MRITKEQRDDLRKQAETARQKMQESGGFVYLTPELVEWLVGAIDDAERDAAVMAEQAQRHDAEIGRLRDGIRLAAATLRTSASAFHDRLAEAPLVRAADQLDGLLASTGTGPLAAVEPGDPLRAEDRAVVEAIREYICRVLRDAPEVAGDWSVALDAFDLTNRAACVMRLLAALDRATFFARSAPDPLATARESGVRAGLEAAEACCDDLSYDDASRADARRIRALASNPARVEAIARKA